MHIAVCDDNVADRKQLERLLKRESDKRAASTGIIYTDSFGNSTALLSNPMQYDAFYIDMCLTEGTTGTDVVNALTAQGVNAPIILCCSKINYREQTYPENVIFLDKPIKVAELAQSIDHALEIMAKAVPLIELREDEDTIYVTEPDILYAEEEGRNVIVTLKDGRTVKVATTAINLFSQIENHPTFFAPTVRAILNGRYMRRWDSVKSLCAMVKSSRCTETALLTQNSFWQSITRNFPFTLLRSRRRHWRTCC